MSFGALMRGAKMATRDREREREEMVSLIQPCAMGGQFDEEGRSRVTRARV